MTHPDSAPLVDALAKNKEAEDEVRQVTDELAVVQAILDKGDAPAEDMSTAAKQAERLEGQLVVAADKLKQVNDALQQEIAAQGLNDDDSKDVTQRK